MELDYQVDLSAVPKSTSQVAGQSVLENNESVVVDGLKKIVDKRVSSLGLSEPNIQTLKYGPDTHIIVQIPTQSYSNLTPEQREQRQKEDITNAKEVIGKVVNLEFRELRTTVTDAEKEERKKLATSADEDLKNLSFNILSQKYHKPNDNIFVKTGTGKIPNEAKIPSLENFSGSQFPVTFPVETVVEKIATASGMTTSTGTETSTSTGYVALRLNSNLGDGKYNYSYVFVGEEP